MKSLANKVIWITGASSGIGEYFAYECAKEDCVLILSARREEELLRVQEACKRPKDKIFILPLDLSKTEELKDKAEQVIQKFGRIDYLFNNGGLSSRAMIKDSPLDVDRRLMEVNYFGNIALTKAVLPFMLEKKSGHIIVTSSVMGKIGTPLRSAYAASKHALHGFYDTLRQEHYHDHIKVSVVCPGYIKTNVTYNSMTADGSNFNKMSHYQENGMTPDVFAHKMMTKIKKGKAEFAIGGIEILGITLIKYVPRFLDRHLVKMHQKNKFSS